MEHEHDSSPQAIKVVDRRRFTATGTVRADAPPLTDAPRRTPAPAPAQAANEPRRAERPAPGPAAASAERARPQPQADADPEVAAAAEEARSRGIDFLPFIASLATNAMAALGMLPDAERQGIPRNPAMAREYIDIIAMLQARTQGNLSAEEAKTLTRLLADLRMQYVELTRSVQRATVAPPPPPHLR